MDIAGFDEFEPFMDHDKKEYNGQMERWFLSKNPTYIHPIIKKGSVAYQNAKMRLKNPDLYPTYKNINITFSKREFLYWWVVQNRFFKMKRPSLGRIDHNYPTRNTTRSG